MKKPHHMGDFDRRGRLIRAAAYANPATRCWRCGLTLEERRATHPRARWTAGHLIDGQTGGAMAAECSPCNYSNGASMGNRMRKRTDLTW